MLVLKYGIKDINRLVEILREEERLDETLSELNIDYALKKVLKSAKN